MVLSIMGDMYKNDSFVSVVLVTKDDASLIEDLLCKLQRYLANCFVDYEIVVVDQHSSDGTKSIVESLLTRIPSVRFLELAFTVHHDVAVAAGLENAIGDFVVIMSPQNDPVDCILDIVKQCRAGSDIVVGVSKQNLSIPYCMLRPIVQKPLQSIGYSLPRNATQLRCLSRRTVNAVTQAGRFHHQFFVRIHKTGYPSSSYEYQQHTYSSRKTLTNGVWEASRLLVFNSTKPLRWMSGTGLCGSLVVFFVALFIVVAKLVNSGSVEGWTSMLLFISMMFINLFIILAFFGEYLGRLLDQQDPQSMYSVVYEKNSSVMLNESRVNVLNDSISSDITQVQTGRNR